MKALLIGGTGTISTAVTHRLLALGWEVTLFNRGNSPAPEGVEVLRGNIRNEEEAAQLLNKRLFDTVVNFIAFTPEDTQRDQRLFHGRCSQYIFISSASAYQKPLTHYCITEATPLANPYWQYSRDKIACEEDLMHAYRETGFPVTIVRPSHTYGNKSLPVGLHGSHGSWQVARRMLAGKEVVIHGDGSSLWTFTHNSDFARGFVGLMGNALALGEAVHITSDESLTWNQAYDIIAAALEVPLYAVHASTDFIIQTGSKQGYDFEGGLMGDKARTVVFDNSKIKRLVPGFAATVRYDQGVRMAIEHIRQNPELQTEDPEFDAYCDRLTEITCGAIEAF